MAIATCPIMEAVRVSRAARDALSEGALNIGENEAKQGLEVTRLTATIVKDKTENGRNILISKMRNDTNFCRRK